MTATIQDLSAYRLYKRMQAVDRNMTLFLDQYVQERAWDAEMNRIYQEACLCGDEVAMEGWPEDDGPGWDMQYDIEDDA